MTKLTKSSLKGQSIVETVVGIIFLIPLALAILDLAVIVLAHSANDQLAKNVARAAAGAVPSGGNGSVVSSEATSTGGPAAESAYRAARSTANRFKESPIIKRPSGGSFLTGFCWHVNGKLDKQSSQWPPSENPPDGDVGVITSMSVNLPVPFPFLPAVIELNAKSIEPIVSIAPGEPIKPFGSGHVGSETGP